MSAGKHHDVLATTCIKFLTLVVGKQIHKELFGAEDTLTEIVKNIAIPNITMRAADEETFEVMFSSVNVGSILFLYNSCIHMPIRVSRKCMGDSEGCSCVRRLSHDGVGDPAHARKSRAREKVMHVQV